MRKIESFQSRQISDLINEQGLAIAEYALEKDFIVTKVLNVLAGLKNAHFDLVFCGGTCLSKAYGLLDRISEDVDIKVVTKPGKTFGSSKRRELLSELKKQTVQDLVAAGFPAENVKVEKALNGNSYILIHIDYESHFQQADDMRAHVKLELNHAELSQPKGSKSIGLLFDAMAGMSTSPRFNTECVDLAEAVVEKLVSFPRRLALHMAHPDREFEPAMVRHLYDVHQILAANPNLAQQDDLLKTLMLAAMDKDAKIFATQHPEFLHDPVGELNRAMARAESDPEIRARYDRFMTIMVYGESPPNFDKAIGVFKTALEVVMPPFGTRFLTRDQQSQAEIGRSR
jgi:predicted nucleotidyltransferase component of viral defense system